MKSIEILLRAVGLDPEEMRKRADEMKALLEIFIENQQQMLVSIRRLSLEAEMRKYEPIGAKGIMYCPPPTSREAILADDELLELLELHVKSETLQ